MTRTQGPADGELKPVRDALLRMARADADAVLARADLEVADLLAQADAEAQATLDRARTQAAEDRAVLVAAERSRVLGEARSVELRARRAAYDALVAAATDAVRAREAADPQVVAVLSERARRELGPDATLTLLPDGGLIAEAGGRRLCLPLSSLVEGAVADLLTSRGTP
jgi:hypothetical protein